MKAAFLKVTEQDNDERLAALPEGKGAGLC
jgi:hypothetical protein